MEQTKKYNINSYVTDKIIADLEAGVRPWQKPWDSDHTHGRIVRPRRHNGLPYNGVNMLLLWILFQKIIKLTSIGRRIS